MTVIVVGETKAINGVTGNELLSLPISVCLVRQFDSQSKSCDFENIPEQYE